MTTSMLAAVHNAAGATIQMSDLTLAQLKEARPDLIKAAMADAAPPAGDQAAGDQPASDGPTSKGDLDCSTNPPYPAANRDDMYRVSVAGKIGGDQGLDVAVDDRIVCQEDNTPEGDQATVGDKWNVLPAQQGAASQPDAGGDAPSAQAPRTPAQMAALAERKRVLAIQDAAMKGQETLAAKLIADGTGAGDAALALLSDYKKRGQHLDALAAQDGALKDVKTAPKAGGGKVREKAEAEMSDDELKAKYAASDELKAEFPNEGAYLGFVNGTKSGRIRILRRKDTAA